MIDSPDLIAELDAWHQAGRRATFWWRDDDAVEPTPALDRLLDLAARHDTPLMLAVIPARATAALVARLTRAGPGAVAVQHGFAHLNHAPAGEKKWELGAHRPLAAVLEELARGRARMDALFADAWLDVLVPPYNRIAPEVISALGRLGYRGLSADGARRAALAAPGVVQVNTHADIMRWDAPRGFLGTSGALERFCTHLKARRLGQADAAEPTGLLTHHLAHDEGCWDFLEQFMPRVLAHPAAAFVHPRTIFAPGGAGVSDAA